MFSLLALQAGLQELKPCYQYFSATFTKKNKHQTSSLLSTEEQICQKVKQFPMWPAQKSSFFRRVERNTLKYFSPKRARGYSGLWKLYSSYLIQRQVATKRYGLFQQLNCVSGFFALKMERWEECREIDVDMNMLLPNSQTMFSLMSLGILNNVHWMVNKLPKGIKRKRRLSFNSLML